MKIIFPLIFINMVLILYLCTSKILGRFKLQRYANYLNTTEKKEK